MDGLLPAKREGEAGAREKLGRDTVTRGRVAQDRVSRWPLQRVLICLFAIQALLAVGLVGYVSFRSARGAVNGVAHELRSEVTTRIEERLTQFLAAPHRLNEVNEQLVRGGTLDPRDAAGLAQHFWQQVLATPTVTSVYFGNPSGGVANAGREGPGGALYEILTDGFAAGTFRKFAVSETGERTREIQSVPNFDARTRPWYTGAVAAGGPTWGPIYLLFSGQDMAISASRPVYDGRGTLIGVASADIFLSQLTDFLSSLAIGKSGLSFICEHASGLLVASSVDSSPLQLGGEGQGAQRLSASASASPVVRAAYAAVQKQEATGTEAGKGHSEFSANGVRHFLQTASLRDAYGIDWLVVVAIPERDFMAEVEANARTTWVLVVLSALLALAFGLATARWVTSPMRALGSAAQALARGEWREVSGRSRIAEVADVSASFNSMSRQVRDTVQSLESEVLERRRAESSLRESEARYRLLADNAADVIWTMDMDGHFTYVSPSVEKLRGYTPEEVMQAPMAAAITPDSLRVIEALLARMRDHVVRGLPVPPAEYIELEQPCRDGSTVWTETMASLLVDDSGKASAILGASRNITGRKQAEQEKLVLEAQLRHSQKLESIGTLASGIAHEVNNPLTGIINYAELIERRIDDPQLQEYARGIIEEGNRVAEIVRGLLSFARQEATERRAAQMKDIVRATLTLIGAALKRDQIQVEEAIEPDLPAVRCSPQQIQQILINLLTNARDALNRRYPGHDENKIVRIHVAPLARGDTTWVRTTVEDHGTGVLAELRDRIFDPFFTTKPRDAGTGLGLSISYGIAREHGGELSVESEEGSYTRFHLDLPPAPDE